MYWGIFALMVNIWDIDRNSPLSKKYSSTSEGAYGKIYTFPFVEE